MAAEAAASPPNDDFTEILRALSLFDALGGIDFVITGYLGTAHQASPIKETLKSWRQQVSGGVYILDPVLGDSMTTSMSNRR